VIGPASTFTAASNGNARVVTEIDEVIAREDITRVAPRVLARSQAMSNLGTERRVPGVSSFQALGFLTPNKVQNTRSR
jgi:hypothetical protein